MHEQRSLCKFNKWYVYSSYSSKPIKAHLFFGTARCCSTASVQVHQLRVCLAPELSLPNAEPYVVGGGA